MRISADLQRAAIDFRYLLNRGYPRQTILDLVGNRYGLTADERHLLRRGVFSRADSEARRRRKVPPDLIRRQNLAIDGYNVLITVEAGLTGRPLVLADDGFVRDISGLSGGFKASATTDEALRRILGFLREQSPLTTLFLFDAPISRSGELARKVRGQLAEAGLPGDAKAVPVPEKVLIGFPGIVATSDTAVIGRSEQVIDLAGDLLKRERKLRSLLRWKKEALPDR